jgi:large subunit ribosomal protein L29
MTKVAEYLELDDDELQNRIASARRELLNLRFQLATGQLDNTERLGQVRRDIARALTVLRARDLYEEDVDLEPLVLTPARRIPMDDSGGIDADAEVEESDEDSDVEDTAAEDADLSDSAVDDADAELEGSEDDHDHDDEDAGPEGLVEGNDLGDSADDTDVSAELPDDPGDEADDEKEDD